MGTLSKASIKKKVIITAALLSVIMGLSLLIYFDPADYFFPRCPFLTLTGYRCPGCGSQRALHQLLHLNIKGAFQYNPFLVLILPYLLLISILEWKRNSKNIYIRKAYRLFCGYRTIIAIFISIMCYWIFRNIYGF